MSKKVHITWEDFAKSLGIDYKGPDEFALSDQAYEEADQFIREYEKDEDVELTEEERFIVQDQIVWGIEEHWSLRKVIDRNLDLDAIVDAINEWGKRGQQSAIYDDVELTPGTAIDVIKTDSEGITLEIFDPFEIAYAESAFCVHGIYYEGYALDDVVAEDIGRVARWISECQGSPSLRLDLDRWEDQRTKPTYWDIVKAIEESRKPKRKRKRAKK